eukprot:1159854-Pelagomonas_calceolata.AAC.6
MGLKDAEWTCFRCNGDLSSQTHTHAQVSFKGVDILADQELRDGVKVFSSWPTYPQLYVKGELVGGCDIILEMQEGSAGAGVLSSID